MKIQKVGVVAVVANGTQGLTVFLEKRERLSDHLQLVSVAWGHVHTSGEFVSINHQRDLGHFAFPRESDRLIAALGGRKGRMKESLVDLNLAPLRQVANQRQKELSEAVLLTPPLQIIVHVGFAQEAFREETPLDSGVQHE